MPCRILVVDDVEEFRFMVRTALRIHAGFEVVGDAATGADAIASAIEHRPDVIVLDLGLPDMPGAQVIRRLREETDARIVVFTGRDVDREPTFDARVEGLVRKDSSIEFLVHLLENLAGAGKHAAAVSLPRHDSSAKRAREFVVEQCTAWSCDDAIHPATLVVSELVTNAVLHAHSHPQLLLSHFENTLRIDVVDDSFDAPAPRVPDPWDEGGRGLFLVAAFSTAWGIDSTRGGKRIWAEVPCRQLAPA